MCKHSQEFRRGALHSRRSPSAALMPITFFSLRNSGPEEGRARGCRCPLRVLAWWGRVPSRESGFCPRQPPSPRHAVLTRARRLPRRPRALPRGAKAEAAPGRASHPQRLPHCPSIHPSEPSGQVLKSQAGVGPGLAAAATCSGLKAQAQGAAEGCEHVDPERAEPAACFAYLLRPLGPATPRAGHRQMICGLCKPTPQAARGRSPVGEAAWGPRAGPGRSGAGRVGSCPSNRAAAEAAGWRGSRCHPRAMECL